MTSELEKQFFDTFGIEPKLVISLEDWESCKDLPRAEELFKHYPQITDHILLELMCILSESSISISFDTLMLGASDVEKLKGYILLACMGFAKYIKHQVCTLFEGSNNGR